MKRLLIRKFFIASIIATMSPWVSTASENTNNTTHPQTLSLSPNSIKTSSTYSETMLKENIALAWGHYQQGQFKQALKTVKNMGEYSPKDCSATITMATAPHDPEEQRPTPPPPHESKTCQSPGRNDVLTLQAWSYFQLEEYDLAEAIAKQKTDTGNDFCKIIAYIRASDAVESFSNQQYQATLNRLKQYPECRITAEQDLSLSGWSHYHLGRMHQASIDFEKLYRLSATPEATDGLVLTHFKSDSIHALYVIAEQQGGPLTGRLPTNDGSIFSAGKNIALTSDLELVTITPQPANEPLNHVYTIAAYQRNHTGEKGLGYLNEWRAPMLQANVLLDSKAEITVTIEQVNIHTGTYKGSRFTSPPTYRLKDGLEPTIYYHHPASTPWSLMLGKTATNNVLSSSWRGRLSINNHLANKGWGLDLFHLPVRETLLSYSGIEAKIDYPGMAWGRVISAGAALSSYYRLANKWTLSGRIKHAQLFGINVYDNSMNSVDAKLNRQLDASSHQFKLTQAGYYFKYMAFSRNLSWFTPGHGGYFSPSFFVQSGIEGTFSRHYNHAYFVSIHSRIGLQLSEEDSAYQLPLTQTSAIAGDYSASKSTSIGGFIEATGSKRLGSGPWFIGALLRYQVEDSGYNETIAGIYLKHNWTHQKRFKFERGDWIQPPYLKGT